MVNFGTLPYYSGGKDGWGSESMARPLGTPLTAQFAEKRFLLPKEYQEVYMIVFLLCIPLPKNAGIPNHHVVLVNSTSDAHRLVSKVIFVVFQNPLSRFGRHCKNRFLTPTKICVLQTISLFHYWIGISISFPEVLATSCLGITTDKTPSLYDAVIRL